MANYTSKSNLKTATGKKNLFDMSKSVVTTSDFGVMKPVEAIMCVPGDQISMDFSQFTRLMPMPAPTFGQVESRVRAFFVPFRTLYNDWKEFISNNFSYYPESSGTPLCPYTTYFHILAAFCYDLRTTSVGTSNIFCTLTYKDTPVPSSSVSRDFTVKLKNGSWTAYLCFTFTPAGRRAYDKLMSMHLGAFLCDSTNLIVTSKTASYGGDWTGADISCHILKEKINVLPLLALAKLYLDWVVPSRWISNYTNLLSLLHYPAESQIDTLNNLSNNHLKELLKPLYSFYDNDFFTSSWQNPYGNEQLQPYSVDVPVLPKSFTDPQISTADGISVKAGSTSSVNSQGGAALPMGSEVTVDGTDHPVPTNSLNVFGLQTLGALQDMLNRGKLAGSKVQDYLFATYGIRPSNDALNLSTYLGSKVDQIQIGDVMASAGTEQNALGQYAGKGIGYSNAKFKYDCAEHGMFIVTHEFAAKPSYIDGTSPMWSCLDRLDFFQPELDSLGVEATPLKFLSVAPAGGNFNPNSIFGYVPRYTRLKTNFDVVSGDFRVPHLNTGLNSWYLARQFDGSTSSLWTQINEKFCQNTADSPLQPLDYIFNDATNDADHFFSVFRFNTKMWRPMLSISDALFNNEHNKLGKNITTNTNGSLS